MLSLATIAVLASPAAAATHPQASYTLKVTGTNLAGGPDTGGSVFVSNVDNTNRFAAQRPFHDGMATFTVPAGHYWAVGIFIETAGGSITQQRIVVLPQFTVKADTSVHIAERAADSKVTMVTPRPARPEVSDFEVRRPGRAGPVQFYAFNDAGIPLWVSPVRQRPTVGKLETFTAQQLVSPPGADTPYEYNLVYEGPEGTIPSQRHVVRASGLASVDARYFQDVATTGEEDRFGMFPAQLSDLQFEADNFFTMPRHQIEYMTGNPAISWFAGVLQCYPSTPCPGGQNDTVRTFRAGERTQEDWNAYPLHPGPNVNLDGTANPRPTLPSASRATNMLTLDVAPFGDNQPGHTGAGFSAASYQVTQDGKQIAAGNAANGRPDVMVHVKLAPRPAVIRFTLTGSRTGAGFPLSSRTHTVWAWHSAPQPGTTLPRGWTCRAFPAPVTRTCAVQPMMTLDYTVRGLSLSGTTAPGRQALTITPGHLQLARAAQIADVRAWVSLDNGTHWHPARVTRHGGTRFTAAFTAPAGSFVTLRVRATDTAGGSITETIDRSYRVGAWPPGAGTQCGAVVSLRACPLPTNHPATASWSWGTASRGLVRVRGWSLACANCCRVRSASTTSAPPRSLAWRPRTAWMSWCRSAT
ncbi:MAG TPA: hypothetical protein VGS19_27105 [Streptosporangiaceae bacterium]|nr:hypothetical protein [Streptosporangiaceae bacterium]